MSNISKEGSIGYLEAMTLSTIALVTKVFYSNPSAVIKGAGTAGWYATILSAVLSLGVFFIICILLKRFPNKDLGEIFEAVFGKIVGKFLSLIFIGYFIFYAGSNIREFLEMIKAYNLPYTPPSIIIFTFLLPVVFISYLGLETLSRISYVSFWTIIFTISLILILNYPTYKFDSLFPLGGYGLKKNAYLGVTRLSAYNEIIILAFLIKPIGDLKKVTRAAIVSIIIATAAIVLVLFCSILKFNYSMAVEHLSNLFELSRGIYFGRFFQRFESIFLVIWVTSSVLLVTIFFYLGLSLYCKSFKINNHKPLILPFIFITFIVTLLPENLTTQLQEGVKFQRIYSFFIVYLIPLITLLASFLLGKKGAKNEKKKT